jgi:hydrogenase maturation protease
VRTPAKVLVAGIGNIFLADDGFGVEVVRRLLEARPEHAWPAGVTVADYGIRGVHLAYDLLDAGYDALVLVDAVPLPDPPGTVVVLDATGHASTTGAATVDAHSMNPDVVLRTLHGIGGDVDRVLVVGCRPAVLEERMGLSAPVEAAVDEAARAVLRVVEELVGPGARVDVQALGGPR